MRLGTISLGLSAMLLLTQPIMAQSVAEIANYSGPDRQKMLEDGARREGALMVYSTGTQLQPLLDAFEAKYPFIKVAMPRHSPADVARLVAEEYGAGVYSVDAYELSGYGLIPLRDQHFLQPFLSPGAANFLPSAIEPSHNWVTVRESYTVIGYNTKIIPPAEAPKTYADLLDPKWKGRIAISNQVLTAANWIGAMVLTHDEAFVRRFAAQDVRLYNITGRALANLTISGEAPLAPTLYQSHVDASKAQGAPIDWNLPGPVPVTDGSAALAAKAPHPHAAMLFVDFLLSNEAQVIYRDLGYYSSHKDLAANQIPGIQKLFLANRPRYFEEFEHWSALSREIFMKGAAASRE